MVSKGGCRGTWWRRFGGGWSRGVMDSRTARRRWTEPVEVGGSRHAPGLVLHRGDVQIVEVHHLRRGAIGQIHVEISGL